MSNQEPSEVLSFEDTIEKLEQIVEQMESGDIKLDDALTLFEKGIHLAKNSQQALDKAEQKVKILMQDQNGEALTDMSPEPKTEVR